MTIIALAGYPASGKSTAAQLLGEQGFPVVSMGETLREAMESSDEDEVWAYAEALREEHGEYGVAVPCTGPIREHLDESDVVVLEGTRNPAEVDYLAAELDIEAHVVWVDATFGDRVRWFATREGRGKGGEDPIDSARYLRERTDREHDAGVRDYFQRADAVVQNNRGLDELTTRTLTVVDNLL